MVIAIFFVLHWQAAVFFQSFYLHRYGAHRQFEMSPRMERVFYFLTWLVQGSSFLSPRGYAILHRLHHAFSDTEKDPHSPHYYRDVFAMMWTTKKRYEGFVSRRELPEARFDGGYPEWPAFDRFADRWGVRLSFIVAYTAFYVAFATHWWMFLLLPAHYLMGPVHGAIVNWAGHKYGYRNYASDDKSRNALFIDVLTMGELFQNNHHKFGMSPSFAVRKFEVDPTYVIMKVLHAVGVIDMTGAQKMRWTPADREPKKVMAFGSDSPRLVNESDSACASLRLVNESDSACASLRLVNESDSACASLRLVNESDSACASLRLVNESDSACASLRLVNESDSACASLRLVNVESEPLPTPLASVIPGLLAPLAPLDPAE